MFIGHIKEDTATIFKHFVKMQNLEFLSFL